MVDFIIEIHLSFATMSFACKIRQKNQYNARNKWKYCTFYY